MCIIIYGTKYDMHYLECDKVQVFVKKISEKILAFVFDTNIF